MGAHLLVAAGGAAHNLADPLRRRAGFEIEELFALFVVLRDQREEEVGLLLGFGGRRQVFGLLNLLG